MDLSSIKIALIVTKRTFQWLLRVVVTFHLYNISGKFSFYGSYSRYSKYQVNVEEHLHTRVLKAVFLLLLLYVLKA